MIIEKTADSALYKPQVKICGLTDVEQAQGCAALGADAIGCVFYPKSPRHLTEQQAKEICTAMPTRVKTVGVFVNETLSYIMRKVERCRLTAVQLHGQESPELVKDLLNENQHLMDTVRKQSLSLQAMEKRYPGISKVKRDPGGAIIIDDEDTG